MPRYEITAPSGQKFEITAPDSATQEQILAYAQANFAQAEQQKAQEKARQREELQNLIRQDVESMSGTERFLTGMGKSFVETGQGISQLFGGGPSPEEIEEQRFRDAPLMETGAALAGNIGGGVAQGLLLPGGSVMTGAKLLPALAVGAGQGALLSGIQPVGEGESRVENAAVGGLLGLAGTGVARGFNRVLDPLGVRQLARLESQAGDDAARAAAARVAGAGDDIAAYTRPAVQVMLPEDIIGATPLNKVTPRREAASELLRQYGFDVSLAQRTGAKPLQTLESVLAEMPATSAQMQAQVAAQQAQFNRQMAKFLGEHGDEITEDTLDSVFKRGNDLYDKIGKSVKVKIDDAALSQTENVWQEASLSLGTEQKALFQGAIDRILRGVDNGIGGDEYVKLRQQLGAASMSADRPFASAMRGLKEVLDDAMERSAGKETAKALQKARQEMRLAIVLRDSGAVKEGSASILKTAGAIERANRKGKMPSDVKAFSRAAAEILPDKTPNSGTAQRLMMQNMLTGAATPGAIGLGTGLLTGDPMAGLGAAAMYYGGPRAVLGLSRSGLGGKWLAGELSPNLPPYIIEALMRSTAALPLAAAESQ